MFAPRMATAQSKASDSLSRGLPSWPSTLATRSFAGGDVEQARMLQATIGNQATLRYLQPLSNPPARGPADRESPQLAVASGDVHVQRAPAPMSGGCRPTARWPGNMEHALIEDDYITNINPGGGAIEYLIPNSGPNGGTGYADMVDVAGAQVYEIKTFVGAPQGVIEAERYVEQAQLSCPPPIPRMWSLGNDYPAHTIPFSPTQELVVQQYPKFPGVVVYYKRKRQPVPDPVPVPETEKEKEKEKEKNKNPSPQLVPIPVTARQVIADFIRRTVQAGLDADRAVADFLQAHPELVYFIAGAGVGLFLATIAEDIATFGAGILDDPATMALAWALFRGAMRYAR